MINKLLWSSQTNFLFVTVQTNYSLSLKPAKPTEAFLLFCVFIIAVLVLVLSWVRCSEIVLLLETSCTTLHPVTYISRLYRLLQPPEQVLSFSGWQQQILLVYFASMGGHFWLLNQGLFMSLAVIAKGIRKFKIDFVSYWEWWRQLCLHSVEVHLQTLSIMDFLP